MSEKKAPKRKKALGRGLEALLGDSATLKEDNLYQGVSAISEISLNQIETNPYQPRTHFDEEALDELAESIKTQGIIQPITLRKHTRNKYQIISGERRYQAAQRAGLKTLPAYIRMADDQQMLEMALVENIQRENLNAIEIALSYQRLLAECDLKQEELGKRVGKNRTTVNNYLRLLKLPPVIQAALRDRKISMGHARAIINVENVEDQIFIFDKAIKDSLSVRQVELLVRNVLANNIGENNTAKPMTDDRSEEAYAFRQLQTKLSSHFGTKVHVVKNGEETGSIKIPFLSKNDLNRILEILGLC